jgi:hypothetical protein
MKFRFSKIKKWQFHGLSHCQRESPEEGGEPEPNFDDEFDGESLSNASSWASGLSQDNTDRDSRAADKHLCFSTVLRIRKYFFRIPGSADPWIRNPK